MTDQQKITFAKRALKSASEHLAVHDLTKAALALDFARGMLDEEWALRRSMCLEDLKGAVS